MCEKQILFIATEIFEYGYLIIVLQKMKFAKRESAASKSNKNASIEWILNLLDNFSKYDLNQRNMRPVQAR
jgi:hypothetical protein